MLDSGNLLFKAAKLPAGPSQEKLTAEAIIKAYTSMQVAAVGVGPLDLTAGLDLLQTSRKQGFPWLSANLLDNKNQPLFSPVLIKKVGKLRAGIIGITGAVSPLPEGITRADWQTVLPTLIARTAKQCDILILLSTLSPAENQAIAQQYPAVHLILAGNQDSGNMNPQRINTTLITQTDRQGKYQGVLTIDWNAGGRWGESKDEELTVLRNNLGDLNRQLNRMRQSTTAQQPEYLAKIKTVEQSRDSVEQQIKTLEQSQNPTGGNKGANCSYSYNFLALKRTLPEAPEIRTILTELKQQINTLHPPKTSKAPALPFLGYAGCKECHPAQTEFWQATHHAKAWQTLREQNQERKLECLPCHVITSPEFAALPDLLLSLPETLQSVGCENCHTGSGRAHAEKPEQFQMTKQVDEKICRTCHSKARDPQFDYLQKKRTVACPVG